MKKITLILLGFVLQCLGITFMLYGLNNSRFLLWTGLSIVFIGFALIIVGVILNKNKTK